ncbi:DUF2029 domain-containing protein [bacterium]|nr:MAG: DUF2029 domain-containing protein [bacterium]
MSRISFELASSRFLTMLAAVLVLAAVAAIPHPAREPGVTTRDFEAYWAAGRAALAGRSPYSGAALWVAEREVPGVDTEREELLPFVSPPAVVPLFAALARLPYEHARLLWLAMLTVCCALGTWASFAAAGWSPREGSLAALAALTFSPLTATLALGQLAGLSFSLLALALLMLPRPWSGIALACSALQPNLTLAALAGLRRSTLAAYALAGALAAAATAATLGYLGGGLPSYLAMLARHGAAERNDAIQFSLPSLLAGGVSHAPSLFNILAYAGPIAAVTLIIALAPRLEPPAGVAFACALSPFALPFFHHHDLIVVLLPAAFALRSWRVRGTLLGALGTALVAVDWLDLAQQPASRSEDLLLGAAAACTIAALHPSRRALWLAAPTLAAIVLVPLAAAHPVPLWPFALPHAFHVPAGLDAAAVWAREQEASGLMHADPLWITLRALPLLGCALLAIAVAATSRDARRSRTSRRGPAPAP